MINTRSFLYVDTGVQPGVKRRWNLLNRCVLSQNSLPVTKEGGIFDLFWTPKTAKNDHFIVGGHGAEGASAQVRQNHGFTGSK